MYRAIWIIAALAAIQVTKNKDELVCALLRVCSGKARNKLMQPLRIEVWPITLFPKEAIKLQPKRKTKPLTYTPIEGTI